MATRTTSSTFAVFHNPSFILVWIRHLISFMGCVLTAPAAPILAYRGTDFALRVGLGTGYKQQIPRELQSDQTETNAKRVEARFGV